MKRLTQCCPALNLKLLPKHKNYLFPFKPATVRAFLFLLEQRYQPPTHHWLFQSEQNKKPYYVAVAGFQGFNP